MRSVSVTGELDLATAPLLGLRLLAVMDDHRPTVIYVDLSGVTFLDCSAIGILVAVGNAAGRTGCQIRIRHPQPTIAYVLDLLGLLGPFTAPLVPHQPPPPSSPSSAAMRDVGATAAVERIAA